MVQIHVPPPFRFLPRSQVVRHQTLTLTFRKFEPCRGSHIIDPLAQSVEHLTFNQRVESSNLSRVTICLYNLNIVFKFFYVFFYSIPLIFSTCFDKLRFLFFLYYNQKFYHLFLKLLTMCR